MSSPLLSPAAPVGRFIERPENPKSLGFQTQRNPLGFHIGIDGSSQKWRKMDGNWILVGGIPTPLKNMKASWDYDIPNIWKSKKCSKPATKIISLGFRF